MLRRSLKLMKFVHSRPGMYCTHIVTHFGVPTLRSNRHTRITSWK